MITAIVVFQLQSSSPCSCARQAPLPVSGVSSKLPVMFEAAGHLEKGHEADVARLCMCVPQFVSAFFLTSPFHPGHRSFLRFWLPVNLYFMTHPAGDNQIEANVRPETRRPQFQVKERHGFFLIWDRFLREPFRTPTRVTVVHGASRLEFSHTPRQGSGWSQARVRGVWYHHTRMERGREGRRGGAGGGPVYAPRRPRTGFKDAAGLPSVDDHRPFVASPS